MKVRSTIFAFRSKSKGNHSKELDLISVGTIRLPKQLNEAFKNLGGLGNVNYSSMLQLSKKE